MSKNPCPSKSTDEIFNNLSKEERIRKAEQEQIRESARQLQKAQEKRGEKGWEEIEQKMTNPALENLKLMLTGSQRLCDAICESGLLRKSAEEGVALVLAYMEYGTYYGAEVHLPLNWFMELRVGYRGYQKYSFPAEAARNCLDIIYAQRAHGSYYAVKLCEVEESVRKHFAKVLTELETPESAAKFLFKMGVRYKEE